jgi:hypothetical protein
MAVATEFRQRAIELLENLPGESLVKAHTAIQASAAAAADLVATESALLEIIQRRLSPEDQARVTYLRQQNETGVITDIEHHELLVYVDRVEQQDGDRAEALIKLAQMRQVDLKVLVDEFLPVHRNVA